MARVNLDLNTSRVELHQKLSELDKKLLLPALSYREVATFGVPSPIVPPLVSMSIRQLTALLPISHGHTVIWIP